MFRHEKRPVKHNVVYTKKSFKGLNILVGSKVKVGLTSDEFSFDTLIVFNNTIYSKSCYLNGTDFSHSISKFENIKNDTVDVYSLEIKYPNKDTTTYLVIDYEKWFIESKFQVIKNSFYLYNKSLFRVEKNEKINELVYINIAKVYYNNLLISLLVN